jgi:hypothetical protein
LELSTTDAVSIQARIERVPFGIFAVAIAVIYCVAYYRETLRPGILSPEGWFAWSDQGFYLKSAQAFAHGLLSPELHWYPPGYALLVAPFAKLNLPGFFIIDLTLMIIIAWLFVKTLDRIGVGRLTSYLTFSITILSMPLVARQYIIPWTSTAATALLMAATYVCVATATSTLTWRKGVVMSFASVGLFITRPTDCAALVPIAAIIAWRAARQAASGNREARIAIAIAVVSALMFGLLAFLLHLKIYGLRPSQYMLNSQVLGLDPDIALFRFYQLFISTSFYLSGVSIIRAYPQVVVGFVALVYCLMFWRGYRALPIAVLVTIALYSSYVDLLPWGVWHYFNIHYFKWTFLMIGLFTAVAATDAMRNPTLLKLVAPAVVAICLTIRWAPIPVVSTSRVIDGTHIEITLDEPSDIRMVVVSHAYGNPEVTYMSMGQSMEADGRILHSTYDFRIKMLGNEMVLVLHKPVHAKRLLLDVGKTDHFDNSSVAQTFSEKLSIR